MEKIFIRESARNSKYVSKLDRDSKLEQNKNC